MRNLNKAKYSQLSVYEKVFLISLVVWIFSQIIRFIALPLVLSVNQGLDAAGWMYPALLDIAAAILAIPLSLAILKMRGFTVWTLTIVYLTLSIIDHVGAFANLILIGEPNAFKQFNDGNNPFIAPIIQTAFDILFFYLLLLPKFRSIFFDLKVVK